MLSERDRHRLVLHLVEMLQGMTTAEACHTLDQAKTLVSVSTYVDVHGEGFADHVDAYNQKFQDAWRPTVERPKGGN